MPAPEQQSDKIAITGLASLLDRAKEGLLERVKELQAEQEDRVSICLLKCINCGTWCVLRLNYGVFISVLTIYSQMVH